MGKMQVALFTCPHNARSRISVHRPMVTSAGTHRDVLLIRSSWMGDLLGMVKTKSIAVMMEVALCRVVVHKMVNV